MNITKTYYVHFKCLPIANSTKNLRLLNTHFFQLNNATKINHYLNNHCYKHIFF